VLEPFLFVYTVFFKMKIKEVKPAKFRRSKPVAFTGAAKETVVFQSGNSKALRLPKGFDLPIGKAKIRQLENGRLEVWSENDWPLNFAEMFSKPLDWERPEQGSFEERNFTW
jgi:virulence-associated protein VagC